MEFDARLGVPFVAPFDRPYETDLTSVLEGLVDARLRMLSPNELDFFLIIDCTLGLRLIDPNFSRSRTLLRLGEASLTEAIASGGLLAIDVEGRTGTARSIPRSMRIISLISFSNMSLISSMWSRALISKSF